MSKNLWPAFELETVNIPKQLLVEQANYFNEQMKNVLLAEVKSVASSNKNFQHTFNIIAPTLNNYTYQLFTVSHTIMTYPLTIRFEGNDITIENESQLEYQLEEIFKSTNATKIVSTLYGQSTVELEYPPPAF